MNPAEERARVAVCICTYRRPQVLASLLERMKVVAETARDVATIGVVVIDDHIEQSSRDVALAESSSFELGIDYRCTGSGNIATARNAALQGGCDLGDFLVLIDDDCVPEREWVAELVRIQRSTSADFVSGRCFDRPPPGAPSWLVDEPFLDDPPEIPDGEAVTMGYVKNLLLSAAAIRRHGLHFDPHYGELGCEDAMFFYAAEAAGIVHHHAHRALVSEEVPAHRATLEYQLRRWFWYGTTESLTTVAAGLARRQRAVLRGGKMSVSALVRPLLRLTRRERPQIRYAVSQLLRGVGRMLGAGGLRFRHR